MSLALSHNFVRGKPDITKFGPTTVYTHGIGPNINWKLDRKSPNAFRNIVDVLPKNIDGLWMPIPTKANAKIAHMFDFEFEDWTMHSKEESDTAVFGKCFADGTFFSDDHVFGMTTADCPVIVLYDNETGTVGAAHAGRDSVLDRYFIETEGKNSGREVFGIVNAMVEMAHSLYRVSLENLCLGIFGGMRTNFHHDPHHFSYGSYNRKLVEYCGQFEGAVLDKGTGKIDMYAVIRGIAINLGVSSENIHFDSVDTGSQVDGNGEPLWASHRLRPGARNLVLVHHHG